MRDATYTETREFFAARRAFISAFEGSYADAEDAFAESRGIEHRWENRPGRIGNGEKVHSLRCSIFVEGDVEYIGSAYSSCGSARWTQGGGRSGVSVFTGENCPDVNCKKCNG